MGLHLSDWEITTFGCPLVRFLHINLISSSLRRGHNPHKYCWGSCQKGTYVLLKDSKPEVVIYHAIVGDMGGICPLLTRTPNNIYVDYVPRRKLIVIKLISISQTEGREYCYLSVRSSVIRKNDMIDNNRNCYLSSRGGTSLCENIVNYLFAPINLPCHLLRLLAFPSPESTTLCHLKAQPKSAA